LIPSEVESFGLAALEAMSCKIPVIASNGGGLPEVVTHEKSGFTVNPGDIDALANYMTILVEDENLRKQMGKQAAKEARERFHPDIIVPQYEDLYKRVVNK
ncbi:MAG: glycosyltransferase, partial [Candidatus Heimdallarchaeota archaeon]